MAWSLAVVLAAELVLRWPLFDRLGGLDRQELAMVLADLSVLATMESVLAEHLEPEL